MARYFCSKVITERLLANNRIEGRGILLWSQEYIVLSLLVWLDTDLFQTLALTDFTKYIRNHRWREATEKAIKIVTFFGRQFF